MGNIRFSFLNKAEASVWLPRLFDILYANMSQIAHSGESYEDEKTLWLFDVGPAMEKEPRKIILMYVDFALAGYFQYYINDQLLMVEEIQIKPEYQRTALFYRFCKYLIGMIPPEVSIMEAYAHKLNVNSQRIIHKLGMEVIGENGRGDCWHYRGKIQRAKQRFLRKANGC